MYEREKQQLIDCARAMERHGLVVLSGGNVSMRMPCGNFLVTPSAMSYDTMTIDDIVLIDGETRTVELQWLPEYTTFSSIDRRHQEY